MSSKLLLASLLFVAAALAATPTINHQTQWFGNVLDTNTHYGVYMGATAPAGVTAPGSCVATTLTNGQSKTVCYHTDKTAYINATGMCYIYFYHELGCTGEPQGWWGYRKNTQVKPVWLTDNHNWKVQDQTSRLSWYDCDDTTTTMKVDCTKTLPGNLPIGCTDYEYTWLNADNGVHNWVFQRLITNAPTWGNAAGTPLSVLVICDNTVPCPRDCTGRKCGEYDSCGRPCVADCETAGYYCSTDNTEYVCTKERLGQLTYYTQVNYAKAGYAPKSSISRRGLTPPAMYVVPTFTHIENAFVDDFSRATEGIVPANAIFFNYRYYTHSSSLIDVYFTINVDTCAAAKSSVTRSSLQQYLAQLFATKTTTYQNNGKLMAGVFTRFMNLDSTFLTSSEAGSGTAPVANDVSEWKSVVIPDSWLPVMDDESGSASLVVCLAAILAALLVHLA